MEGPTFSQTHDSTSKQNEIMHADYLILFSVYFRIVTNNTFIIFRYLKKLVKLFTVQSIMFVIVASTCLPCLSRVIAYYFKADYK